MTTAGIHLSGSLALTWMGMQSARWWWRDAI
jgi:hypothetical protein